MSDESNSELSGKIKPEIAIAEQYHKLLHKSLIGIITSVRHTDKNLSSHPVGFVLDNGVVRISSLKNRMKYKNVMADPRISFCVVSDKNVMEYVELRGYATIEDDVDRSFARRQFVEGSGGKEPPEDMDPPEAERVIITIHPQQVSSPTLYGGRFDKMQEDAKSS